VLAVKWGKKKTKSLKNLSGNEAFLKITKVCFLHFAHINSLYENFHL
jgi:hypothetical protein